MTKDPENKEPAFKVIDRRRFTEDGQEKDSEFLPPEEEQKKPKAEHFEQPVDRLTMTFSLFIRSLAHQAMMGLGVMPWPDSGLVRVDLTLAKETIDILQILKEKTTSNLTKDEQSLLDNLLYQLQVAYVEIAKKPIDTESGIIK